MRRWLDAHCDRVGRPRVAEGWDRKVAAHILDNARGVRAPAAYVRGVLNKAEANGTLATYLPIRSRNAS